jgi:NADPH:quinone reductase
MVIRSPDAMRLESLSRKPVGASEVRVAIEAAGVNPVDAQNRAEPSWAGLRFPFVVGYEFAGRVT